MVSAQATGDHTMNKIADYLGVHYTFVSLTIERLAEECMIARLDPEFYTSSICRACAFMSKYGYIMHTCARSEHISRVAFNNS